MADKAKMDAIKADYRSYLVECGEEPVSSEATDPADRLDQIKAALAAGNEDEWWPLDEMYHLTPAQDAFYSAAPESVAWLIRELEHVRGVWGQAENHVIGLSAEVERLRVAAGILARLVEAVTAVSEFEGNSIGDYQEVWATVDNIVAEAAAATDGTEAET